MKKSIIIASLLSVMSLFTTSCIKEYVEPNDGTDIAWYIAGRAVNNYEPILIETGDYLGFMDCSLGTLMHKWEVTGSGCYMLTGTITSTTMLEQYIDPLVPEITDDAGYVTDDTTIAVLFQEEGMKSVRLSNTYSSPVTHYYTQRGSDDASTVYQNTSELIAQDQYLLDTIMYVQVFDPIIVASAKVYTDPELTQEVATGTDEMGNITESIEIKFGETLYFVDDSYYEPNAWTWTCAAAGITTDSPVTGNIAAMTFNATTSGTQSFKVALTATRSADVDGYDAELPTGKSVATTIPLNIYVRENVRDLNPVIRLSSQDRRTVQIELDNTTFNADDFLKSLSGDVGVAEAYAALLETVKLNRVSSTGATSTLDCTDIEIGSADDGEQENILNFRFAAEGEASLYNTDSSITLRLDQEIKTALTANYGSNYTIAAGAYTVEPGLYENILPREINDLNYLYEVLCDECNLPYSKDLATVTSNNANIYFRQALYKRVFSAYDDSGNETCVFTLVRDPYAESSVSDADIDMVLQLDFHNVSTKLRLGTDYSFDIEPAMYYYTMDLAVDTATCNPLATSSMAMSAYVCEPYPALFNTADYFGGSTVAWFAATAFKASTTDNKAENQWANSEDYDTISIVTSTTKGYGLSFSLVIASVPAGSRMYLKNLKISNAAL